MHEPSSIEAFELYSIYNSFVQPSISTAQEIASYEIAETKEIPFKANPS